MSTRMRTEGNLALAFEAPQPVFTVVDGFKERAPYRMAPEHEASSASSRRAGALLVVIALAAVFTLAIGMLAMGQASLDAAIASRDRIEIVVDAGDTLWGIASDHAVDGLSTQDTVDVVRAWNGLTSSSLTPGTTLVVPA